jgi:hypothetical protein
MKKIILNIIALVFSFSLFSQDVLFSEIVKDYNQIDKIGPNCSWHNTAFMGFGFAVAEQPDSTTFKPFGSSYLDLGFRSKKKVTNFVSVVGELGVRMATFKYDEDDKIIFANNTKKKHTLNQIYLYPAIYLRFNFDVNRGNFMGKYIEFGASMDYYLSVAENMEFENGDIKSTTNQRGFDYAEPMNFSAHARLGFNWFAIKASYRLNPFYNDDNLNLQEYFDLPQYSVGFEFQIL